ncbi:MAG: type I-C CRISPR-associated protein Cas8c/Csd1 [Lentisphaerae bacterium]|nr:type I-C CRISPR-associated protein Cas8c/Csd1 [Lentisphaerota bacterium]
MILQALKEYYDRKAADPDSGIAPPGWEKKELPFIIVIDDNGNLINFEDTREMVGKKKVAKTFLVPKAVKRSSGVAANFLWDNVEYALGIRCKAKEERVTEQHQAFLKKLDAHRDTPAIAAILKFLHNPNKESQLKNFPSWEDAQRDCSILSFRINGHSEPVFRETDIIKLISENIPDDGDEKIRCLVTGNIASLANLHAAIKGVRDTNTSGGNIVSFNIDAANSFGKKQGANAPVGKEAEFAYTTALNTLLAKNSDQKMNMGGCTVVFWAAKENDFETEFGSFFSEPDKDDPDRRTGHIKALYTSVADGSFITDDDPTVFYILGLAPNAARISIRFWQVTTVAQAAARIRQYFDDIDIYHREGYPDYPSIWRLLVSTASMGKTENILPNQEGDMMRAILEGLPFPMSLLQQVMLRVKCDRDISTSRIQLIKGFLNRQWRVSNPNNERSITVSLDNENTNIGYRLGRLFAALEKIQQEANPGINATIKDRFYASASSTPAVAFAPLIRLSKHHLAKLEREGRKIYFEKLIGDILDEVPSFPTHLSLIDQGQFAIGYYHQNRDFFTKNNN